MKNSQSGDFYLHCLSLILVAVAVVVLWWFFPEDYWLRGVLLGLLLLVGAFSLIIRLTIQANAIDIYLRKQAILRESEQNYLEHLMTPDNVQLLILRQEYRQTINNWRSWLTTEQRLTWRQCWLTPCRTMMKQNCDFERLNWLSDRCNNYHQRMVSLANAQLEVRRWLRLFSSLPADSPSQRFILEETRLVQEKIQPDKVNWLTYLTFIRAQAERLGVRHA